RAPGRAETGPRGGGEGERGHRPPGRRRPRQRSHPDAGSGPRSRHRHRRVVVRADPRSGTPALSPRGAGDAGGPRPVREAPRGAGGRLSVENDLAYLAKGCVDVVTAASLRTKLARGKPFLVNVGFDPATPDLRLRQTVLIRKMKHFQDVGHRVVFVIGDFTGMIGDPTGRSKTRPPLTREEIEANAETYKKQVFKILDP